MSIAPPVPTPTPRAPGAGHVIATIIGCALALAGALAVLAAAGLAVAQLTLPDDDGYYTSPREQLVTSSAAISGQKLSLGDIDDGTGADVVDALAVRARITAQARDGRAVFIGIGPSAAVERYLAGAPHAQVYDVREGDVILREHPGERRLAPPAGERFWVESTQGAGRQQLTWKATSGRWSAVVMNANAARGIDVSVRVGAKVGALPWIAGGIGAIGLVLLVGGGALVVIGLRPAGDPHVSPLPDAATPASRHPVRVEATLEEPLSRWLWLVKWVLVIPHLLCLIFLWAAFVGATIVAWFAIVASGRYPRAIFDFNVGVLRWTWRVEVYANGAFATDRYPPFTLRDDPTYPARLEIPYAERLSRGKAWVKTWLLAIPHYAVLAVFWGAGPLWAASGDWRVPGLLVVLLVIAVVVLAVTGRYPRDLFRLIVGIHRWTLRVIAYAALMRDEYPPFRLDDDQHAP